MADRSGIFAGDDPFQIAKLWLDQASATEPNDPGAIALATVDKDGKPNVRIVLLQAIKADRFVFFTNYASAKGQEIQANSSAAFSLHWKSLERQIRVRGAISRSSEQVSDAYFKKRARESRIGAWASRQSEELKNRAALIQSVSEANLVHGTQVDRPDFWGGFDLVPMEIEFWAAGKFRLHDRFRWSREIGDAQWAISRLNP